MKKLLIPLCIMIFIGLFTSCKQNINDTDINENTEKDNETSSQTEEIDSSEEDIAVNEEYLTGNFNLSLLKAINDSDNSSNIFYSEYSINSALSMVMMGASGKTLEEMLNVLGYSDGDLCQISNDYETEIDRYNSMTDSTVNVANSVWIDDEAEINQDYLDKVKLSFDAEANDIDLQSDKAVNTINKWISKKTNKMIQDILKNPFDPLDRLVLVNAIYFKGDWTMPFDHDCNIDMDFSGTKQTTEDVEMMTSSDSVYGYIHDDCRTIKLNYGKNMETSMILVLPDNDIDEFISSMDEDKYIEILSDFEVQENANIIIPKFTIEQSLNMNDILISLGMKEAFITSTDFDGIGKGLFLSKVIHQAKVSVGEAGTEASAATVVIMSLRGAPLDAELFEFIANKPFVFFIVDNENNKPLFTGVIKNLE